MSELTKTLISGRLLGRNTIWNFVGMAAPMLVAIVVLPLLIDGFGKERFGLLTIIWMGVGYFSLFDMGFGQALTKLVSDRIGTRDTNDDLGSLLWTALSLIFIFGLLGATIVISGAGVLIHDILNVEVSLQSEGINAMKILALGIPAVVLSTGFIGILQAHQKFATITAVRIPLGILTFGGPLVTLQFSPSLTWATVVLVTVRLIALIFFYFAATYVRPELMNFTLPQRQHVFPLFHFGGWLTVTNIVSPLMHKFDRFLIGALVTMTAVSYYVTPYEVLSRLQILPNSMINVLFPALAMALMTDKKRLVTIYSQASQIIFLFVLPVLSTCFLLAPEGLEIWLGDDFRQMATPVVRWLAVGVIINTLARIPFTLLQSAGRPDLIAKTHLLELLPYMGILWIFTNKYGIAGTAAAWSLRVLVDTIILNWITRLIVPELKAPVFQTFIWIAALLVGFAFISTLTSLFLRVLLLCAVSLISALLLWPVVKKMTTGVAIYH